jgi:hypothetical protein
MAYISYDLEDIREGGYGGVFAGRNLSRTSWESNIMEPRISKRHIDPYHDRSSEGFRLGISHLEGRSASMVEKCCCRIAYKC